MPFLSNLDQLVDHLKTLRYMVIKPFYIFLKLTLDIFRNIHYKYLQLGLAEKVHKTNLDATGREKW
jgi:hypothetical protein